MIDVLRTHPTDEGIKEGDYNIWSKKWLGIPSNGIYDAVNTDIFIDDENEKLHIIWLDKSSDNRFAIYDLSDFSAIYESPLGVNYTYDHPTILHKNGFVFGVPYLFYGGVSKTIQSYLLLLRNDVYTIEVWQGGTSPLWSRNIQLDFGKTCYCYAAGLSPTGKYIIAVINEGVSPHDKYLMLYEGTKV